jgi:hypothetical protein
MKLNLTLIQDVIDKVFLLQQNQSFRLLVQALDMLESINIRLSFM